MAVNDLNVLYAENLTRWQMMQDVCNGSRAIKMKSWAYLPIPCCNDDESRNFYENMLQRAVFYPVTKDTLQNHVGLAFSEDPTFDPDGMDFLKDDADGSGTSIYQLNQKALASLLKFGRGGFFVDYPTVTDGATRTDVVERGIRPTIVFYDALQVINWRLKKIGGVYKYSLIVLLENTYKQDPEDEFKDITVKNYRVLRLDDNNEYSVQVYEEINGAITPQDIIYPNMNGKRSNEIPFIAIGSQSNDLDIDEIPLESLAEINLAHYRNSASYEQSVYICGEVQPVLSELPLDFIELIKEEGGIKLGSYTPLTLPQGANFDYVSADIEMVAKDAMDAKFEYMEALGAKVLDKTSVNKTATQVDEEAATQHSVLSLCVSNLNEASEYYLRWCADYHGSGYDAKFSIKQDFARGEIGLEMLKFYQSEVVRGAMSNQTFSEIKITGKVPEISHEEEQERIESERNGLTL